MDFRVRKKGLHQSLAEARLGFNFGRRGISREHRAKKTPETLRLLEFLYTINRKYVSYLPKKLSTSKTFRSEAKALFEQLGPTLWPDEIPGEHPTWLLRPDQPDLYDPLLRREYPERLFYSNLFHRERLWNHFFAFISLKVFRFHCNNSNKRSGDFGVDSPSSSDGEDDLVNEDEDDDEISRSSSLSSLSATPEPNDLIVRLKVPLPRVVSREASLVKSQALNGKRTATSNDDGVVSKRSKDTQEVHKDLQVTPNCHLPQPDGSRGLPIDLTNDDHRLQGHSQVQKHGSASTPLLSRGRALQALEAARSRSLLLDGSEFGLKMDWLGSDGVASQSSMTTCNHDTNSGRDVATRSVVTMTDGTDRPPAPVSGSVGPVNRLHFTPIAAGRIVSDTHGTVESHIEARLESAIQPQGYLEPQSIRITQGGSESQDNPNPRSTPQSSVVRESLTPSEPQVSRDNVPQERNSTQQAVGATSGLTIVLSDATVTSADIELDLYIDGKANLDPAESDGWLLLTDMTDQNKLFSMTQDDLHASGHLDANDTITAIRFEHADGVIPGTDQKIRWIKRVGQQDMWKRLLKMMSEAETWSDGRKRLRGYVRAQKSDGSR